MRKKNQFWIILLKVIVGFVLALLLTLGVVLLIASMSHKRKLAEEEQYLVPPGQMVEVDGHKLHVMHEGDMESEYTLVFLHSNKVIDDAIVMQPLFKELMEYELIYVDRSGYGFSEDADVKKDVASMVEETRAAVCAVTDSRKYILVASKSAGLEAISWANTYPEEVQGIIGLEMYFPDQYSELDDDTYCTFGNKILVKLVSIGAHRYAQDIYPSNDFSLYTDKQMATRDALVSKSFYTEGMYREDAWVVKNGKKLIEAGWPEEINMYLLYANPFMDPYLHENGDMLELYNQVQEQGEEYDPVTSYNDYYRTYLAEHKNVTMEEISGPERLVDYAPDVLAGKIKDYLESFN